MKQKIAIQGFEGSFHQMAAMQHFGDDIDLICCSNFRQVIRSAVSDPSCVAGVMAIENSIAGSILPNYNLIAQSNLQITGEVYLQIDQNLLVNPGVTLDQIEEVHSHPMALLQCAEYLEKHPWKIVESEDTALSAARIKQDKSTRIAAIAGAFAARLFGLNMIAPDIQTQKNNYTRFWVLQKSMAHHHTADKASMVFHTDHSKGSLARVLGKISECGVNLSKLQSFPIAGSDWKYQFHADCEFADLQQWQHLLEVIRPVTAEVMVYGVYKNGKISAV